MQELINEIADIPGVLGSCIFDRNRGMLFRKLKVDLPGEVSDGVGTNFIRLLQMAAMNNLEIGAAQFKFDRYWLIGIPLNNGIVLLIICDLQANSSLVVATAAMLAEDLLGRLEQQHAGRPEQKSGPVAGTGKTEKSAGEAGDDWQRHLAGIEAALAAAIGPVARMVMADTILKWEESGPPSTARLPALGDLLAEEIEDPVLVAEFRDRLKKIF